MRPASAMSPQRILFAGAAAGGLALGAVAWLAFGGSSAAQERLQSARSQLESARLGVPRADAPQILLADASARPLFALTTGRGAVPDVVLKLDGVASTPQHVAVLLSINGADDVWLERGKSASGVTLISVSDAGATVETALGEKQVELGQDPRGAQPPGAALQSSPNRPPSTPPPFLHPPGDIPRGMHLPPPPASAPSMP